jgi:hypothetical protein
MAVALVLSCPWFFFTLLKTGHLLPTTHAGKLASNLFNAGLAAKGIKTYLLRHLRYLYEADRGVLFLIIVGTIALLISVALIVRQLRARAPGEGRGLPFALAVQNLSPAGALVIWEVMELGLYTLAFRSTYQVTPYHNLRYQVMLIPAALAGGGVALVQAAWRISTGRPSRSAPRPGLPLIYLIALLALAGPLAREAVNLPGWRRLYLANVEHLQKVHRAAAQWARDNTSPQARIASLDIGMLGYYSQRYVIDLGGLLDPSLHPWLKQGRVGPYLVNKGATYYFSMIRPASEKITGVQKDEGALYHLELAQTFHYPSYAAPVLLHSLGLEAYRVLPHHSSSQ